MSDQNNERSRVDTGKVWTPELDAQLRRARAEGLSLARIAHRLGITRGAAAGRVRRLSLPGRSRKRRLAPVLPDVPPEAPPEGHLAGMCGPGKGVGMAELTRRQCAWPLWEDDRRVSFRCCGKPVKSGFPYCAAHLRKAMAHKFKWTEARQARLAALVKAGESDPARLAQAIKAPREAIEDRLRVIRRPVAGNRIEAVEGLNPQQGGER